MGLFDDFRVFYEDAGTMIKENLDHNSATRIKRIHKFLKDAKAKILAKSKPLGEEDRAADEGWLKFNPEEFPTDLIPEGLVKEWEKKEKEKETSRYTLRSRTVASKVLNKIASVITPTKIETRDSARRESRETTIENPLRSSTPEGSLALGKKRGDDPIIILDSSAPVNKDKAWTKFSRRMQRFGRTNFSKGNRCHVYILGTA